MLVNIDSKISFFRELISCCHDLNYWIYNKDFEVMSSNSTDEQLLSSLLTTNVNTKVLKEENYNKSLPVILTNQLDLMWILHHDKNILGEWEFIHVIGPAFYADVSSSVIEKTLEQMNFSFNIKSIAKDVLEKLPVISTSRMFEYSLMLHYTLTGEKISIYENQHLIKPTYRERTLIKNDWHGTWAAEQELLKIIEDGNLNYRETHAKLVLTGEQGKLSVNNPIRHYKNLVIIFTALCTRAAIRGGLSPETAYTTSDFYIQDVETCSTIPELINVNRNMQDDFVKKVHQIKNLQGDVSLQIRECCNFIQLNITEKISISTLASKVGYAENYLSKKFKREMGQKITEYISATKIDYAKNLLSTSELSIQEIAEKLSFGTQSYFCENFKKYVGVTAVEYRNQRSIRKP